MRIAIANTGNKRKVGKRDAAKYSNYAFCGAKLSWACYIKVASCIIYIRTNKRQVVIKISHRNYLLMSHNLC